MAAVTSNPQSPSSDGSSWQSMLDAVVPAVVALSVTAVRGFQDDTAGAQGGTGFVVDAKQGLLLTNRHVSTCGPQRASAAFVGCPATEEVKVSIAYVDPIHDFAFLRFDPNELQQTPLTEIPLDPWGCKVGEEIRVVGNDSLEKLQILSGTIARVDRNPPELDGQDYNDENSFYALAASGTRGGSSGSPVLNRQGKAIALNAAATGGTMHAFYLPLHRIVRALDAVRSGSHVPRGTMCAAFRYISFPECFRLGVEKSFVQTSLIEGDAAHGATFSKAAPPGGMLQVHRCIPGSEAAALLQTGDVLLEVAGRPCADFVLLDAAMDDAVGGKVQLTLCRGGQRLVLDLSVKNLHCLIPHAFIEMSLGIFHEVPYQTAQRNNVPLQGVYVATAGAVFGQHLKSDTLIQEINGTPCPNLKAFEEAIQVIPDKELFHVVWSTPSCQKERRRHEGSVKMMRQWGSCQYWELDAKTRRWTPQRQLGLAVPKAQEIHEKAAPSSPAPLKRRRSSSASSPAKLRTPKRVRTASAALDGCICQVTFRALQHFAIDIVASGDTEGEIMTCRGAGIVINAEEGLVLTDRVTVPQPLGDVEVMVGDDIRSASSVFFHPLHNMVILRVDKCKDGCAKAFGSTATFRDVDLEEGEECDFVGFSPEGQRLSAKVHVQEVRLGKFPSLWPPRWHERNLEAIVLSDAPSEAQNGVLCNGLGQICAMYTHAVLLQDNEVHRLGYGIPVQAISPLLKQVVNGFDQAPSVPSLEVQLQASELSNLRRLPQKLRPSEAWFAKLTEASGSSASSGSSAKALLIEGITSRGPCDGLAVEGDLLVAVDGEVVSTVRAIEARMEVLKEAAQKADSSARAIKVPLTLLRRGTEIEVVVSAPLLGSDGSTRILGWHGLVVQELPRAIREVGAVPEGVHISQTLLGSPAETFGIEGDIIVSVDGKPTPNLDSLLKIGQSQKDGYLRIETADTAGRHFLKTLEPDTLFWPRFEMMQDGHGAWSYHEVK
eukprot:TRINITY_DN61090_c0_g1_i1.p1 TRINITY_DN61090_c0_g1~~TRINITY_DN61090_c0_g1_i1.p1  ORF type:complete len:998 (+),score=208.07 TRINITY_DN61090_c0_g1_i1:50-3043(+)